MKSFGMKGLTLSHVGRAGDQISVIQGPLDFTGMKIFSWKQDDNFMFDPLLIFTFILDILSQKETLESDYFFCHKNNSNSLRLLNESLMR